MLSEVFILKYDLNDQFLKDTIVLEGNDDGRNGTEYFDMTYELKNGWGVSYSYYNIPKDALLPASEMQKSAVADYLRKAANAQEPEVEPTEEEVIAELLQDEVNSVKWHDAPILDCLGKYTDEGEFNERCYLDAARNVITLTKVDWNLTAEQKVAAWMELRLHEEKAITKALLMKYELWGLNVQK